MSAPSRVAAALLCALTGSVLLAACQSPDQPIADEISSLGIETRIIDRGVLVFIPDVLFAFDSDHLSKTGRAKVKGVAEVIERMAAGRVISVEGHTDAIGTEAYNVDLSRRRAQGVADDLVAGGVEARLIRVVAMGETHPIAPNKRPDGSDDPEGRRLNRRVEVVILNR